MMYTSRVVAMYVCLVNRTQIYLDAELQDALRHRAEAENRSVADIIREAVRRFLAAEDRPRDPFLALSGKFRGGAKDSARNHDRYLYGGRRLR